MSDATNRSGSNSFAAFRGRWIERGLRVHGLSDGAFRVLVCLAFHFLHGEKRTCWPSQGKLAEAVGMRVRTVQSHLAELRLHNLLKVQRQGRDRPNVYVPIVDDTQVPADHNDGEVQASLPHDTQKSADQKTRKTRKISSDDAQKSVSKTRRNLRGNTLKEPIEEPFEGGGGLQPPSAVPSHRNSVEGNDLNPRIIEEAPSYAPEGASGASIVSEEDDEDHSWFFDETEFEEFGESDTPAEFLGQGIPDLPIRAAPKDWRRLLAWIGKTYGPSALQQATAAKRTGTLTIEMIQDFGEHAEDVA